MYRDKYSTRYSYVPDSDDDEEEEIQEHNHLPSQIIKDSDEENLSKESNDSTNSEQEDLEFLNNSHKVSIVEDSSKSDTDSDSNAYKTNNANLLKRRSIYDTPRNLSAYNSPNSQSTPTIRYRKRSKRTVIYSDSDSEDNARYMELKQDNMQLLNGSNGNAQVSNFRDCTKASKNIVDLTMNTSHHNTSVNIDSKINNVDLTRSSSDDQSLREIENTEDPRFDKKESDSDDVIICSSSTTDNEMDKDALAFAKKEIGVGNIDPIAAQKKEYYLLNIKNTQTQLDKLNKFATSVDINKLPDKGEKVHEAIKQHKIKLAKLTSKLAELPSIKKSSNNNPATSSVKVNIPELKKEILISSSSDSNSDDNEKKDVHTSIVKKVNTKRDDDFHQFNEFNIEDIPQLPNTDFDAADLGKKALATLNKQQSLTHNRIEQLHGSLVTRPTEDQREKDPAGLKVALMPHQQHALAWMKWRETQKPKGGILADDMGLGKTLSMISLILNSINDGKNSDSHSNDSSSDDGWISRNNKHKRYYGGTLVVCPASLIRQWEAEVKNRCKRGLLSVLVFHGSNRNIDDRKLSKYSIVITTYHTLVREADTETGMYKMEWKRVILDEAHYIRNHKSKASIAACGLNAKFRWALTGTPIQNKEMDLYAILKFLNCTPFDDLGVWKRWVDNKNDAGKQRLVTLMKTLMLRRTKQELQAKGSLQSLPDKNLEIIEIEIDREENLVYQKILLFSQSLFAQFLSQRAEKQHIRELNAGKFDRPSYSSRGQITNFTKAQKVMLAHHSNIEAHEILVLLLRLRQMCCHPALLHSMLDKHDTELSGLDDKDEANTEILNQLRNMSINEDENIEEHVANYQIDERVAANLLTKKNPIFNDDRCSSKVRAVVGVIEEIVDKGDKLIVVSQWTSFLNVIARNLKNVENANYAMFTGQVAIKHRQAIIDKFNDPNEDVNILFLSLTAGGVGLNLVGANHLLLVDIHWNPQLEAQAQDRIYRFGQTKSVYIYKFICKDTIEERVKKLQDRKLEIANHVLTGTKSVSSKLSIDDLKLLFS